MSRGQFVLRFGRVVFIQVKTDEEQQLFTPQMPTVVALSKGCKSAKVVRDAADVPAGCGSAVVTPTIIVHTLVRVRAFFFLFSSSVKTRFVCVGPCGFRQRDCEMRQETRSCSA